jgi:predicted nucleic acid-binding protein
VILVDTSIWIDHLRNGDPCLTDLLDRDQVVTHPFVVGELSLGHLRRREIVLGALQALRQVTVARVDEVQGFVARHRLFGSGLGYVDAHLLTSVRLTPEVSLWTRDKRLLTAAQRLSLAALPTH